MELGVLLGVGALVSVAVAVAWVIRGLRLQFGAASIGARADRVRQSPQFRNGAFHNSVPASVPMAPSGSMLRQFLFGRERRKPTGPIPVVDPTGQLVAEPDRLLVTWYGHSSALVEIDGQRVLCDPVWSDRCSPSGLVGPRRLHPPPVPLGRIGRVDAIVISHDHYDHLDMASVRTLTATQRAPFLVPLGVGAHLERWGVPADRIVELDWGQSHRIGPVEYIATSARHFSGRAFSRNTTLWASWVLGGTRRKVFYTGDSGYFDGYARIGEEHGPFDATLMQIGAYGDAWPDIHMTPEEGVAAHLNLRGHVLVPLHWATFVLAFHDWAEPVERVWREAKARDVTLVVPRPGERVNIDDPPEVEAWWQPLA
jgi:L-ascorbate metabolism protein UlaG (beta-lactamase superfamily)